VVFGGGWGLAGWLGGCTDNERSSKCVAFMSLPPRADDADSNMKNRDATERDSQPGGGMGSKESEGPRPWKKTRKKKGPKGTVGDTTNQVLTSPKAFAAVTFPRGDSGVK